MDSAREPLPAFVDPRLIEDPFEVAVLHPTVETPPVESVVDVMTPSHAPGDSDDIVDAVDAAATVVVAHSKSEVRRLERSAAKVSAREAKKLAREAKRAIKDSKYAGVTKDAADAKAPEKQAITDVVHAPVEQSQAAQPQRPSTGVSFDDIIGGSP